ncbi:MAG: Uma2 family endonuclease [Gemmatimonadetes bacterium]|nr:Uma2 family endonuclease [Gemmatimonadota bacterium]
MVMPELDRIWSREQVLALPDDGKRYELVDGELLVSSSPRFHHQLAISVLYDRIRPYLARHSLGLILTSPADLDLRSGQLLQPDLFVVSTGPNPPIQDWSQLGIPALVIEVLSPSTARQDRITKRRRYQRSGVPACWLVDLDARQVEVWIPDRSSPRIVGQTLAWQPSPLVEPLVIDLAECFREILG